MSSIMTLPLPVISPEVHAFACAHGIDVYLPALSAAARRIFPEASIAIQVEGDPEICDNEQIVFAVEDNGRDSAAQSAAHQDWADALLGVCPAPQLHLFCLLQGPLR